MQASKPSKVPTRLGATKALGGALALPAAKTAAARPLLKPVAKEPEDDGFLGDFDIISDDEGTQKVARPAVSGAKLGAQPHDDAAAAAAGATGTEPQQMDHDTAGAEDEYIDVGDYSSGRGSLPAKQGPAGAEPAQAVGEAAQEEVGASAGGSYTEGKRLDIKGHGPAGDLAGQEALGGAEASAAALAAQTALPEGAKAAGKQTAADVQMADADGNAGGGEAGAGSGGGSAAAAAAAAAAGKGKGGLSTLVAGTMKPSAATTTPAPASGAAAQTTPVPAATDLPEPQGPKKPAPPRSRLGTKQGSTPFGPPGGPKLQPAGQAAAAGPTPQLGKPPAAAPPAEASFHSIFSGSWKKKGANKGSKHGGSAGGSGPGAGPAAAPAPAPAAAPSLHRQVLTKKPLPPAAAAAAAAAPSPSPAPFTPVTVLAAGAVTGGAIGGVTGGATPATGEPLPHPADPLLALDFSSHRSFVSALTEEALAAETASNGCALAVDGGGAAAATYSLGARLRTVAARVETLHRRADEVSVEVARLGAACAVAAAAAAVSRGGARAAAAAAHAAWAAAGMDDPDNDPEVKGEDEERKEAAGESMEVDGAGGGGGGLATGETESEAAAAGESGDSNGNGEEGGEEEEDPEAGEVDIVGTGAGAAEALAEALAGSSLLGGTAGVQAPGQVEVRFDDAEMGEVGVVG